MTQFVGRKNLNEQSTIQFADATIVRKIPSLFLKLVFQENRETEFIPSISTYFMYQVL
jgi:hypothetical protein